MSTSTYLIDAAERPRSAAVRLARNLDATTLNAHPGGHDNSIAWLLWHTAREIDVQVSGLSGNDQVWQAGGYGTRTGLGETGAAVGYGHTPDQAREIRVDDVRVLLDYLSDATDALIAYLTALDDAAFAEVIDENWDPPVTRGVRLVSIIDDAAQHIGQAAYAAGALASEAA